MACQILGGLIFLDKTGSQHFLSGMCDFLNHLASFWLFGAFIRHFYLTRPQFLTRIARKID